MDNLLDFGPSTQVVLIGTSASPKDRKTLPPLPHVVQNIEALTRLFTDPEVIGLKKSESIVQILDEKSAIDVLEKVETAAQAAVDTLLVYYAGHGLYGDAKEELYLVAKDSTSKRKSINAIAISKLKDAIANSPAKRKILILDCCYSGRAFKAGMGPESNAKQSIDIEGTYGVAAAPANHKALAIPGEPLTVFTQELVNVLENGLQNNKSTLTLDDIFGEVRAQLKRKAQTPVPEVINWKEAGLFRFARNRYGKQNTSNELVRKVEDLKELVEERFTKFDELIKELRHRSTDEVDVSPHSPGVLEITSQAQFERYLTFISIVFAVFIAIWVEPVLDLSRDILVNVQNPERLDRSLFWKTGQGVLIFHILVCLWWWYGMFLGRVDPARSFFKYGFDFMTFCSFAITFRIWTDMDVFPIVVFFAAGLMSLRFGNTAWHLWRQQSTGDALASALKALLYLLLTLGLFVAFAATFVLVAWLVVTDPQAMEMVIRVSVLVLLLIGVVATLAAVRETEGITWSWPRRWYGYPKIQTITGAEMVADSDSASDGENSGD